MSTDLTSIESLHGVRVLLLEDDPDIRESTALALRREGAEVVTAATGQEAVDVYAERPPDVVLSDILLPQVDGHAVLRYLRRLGMTAPAIAMTCLSAAEARFQSAQVGFDLHLTKPIEPEILLRAILDLLPTKH
jgi:CheY-like chemotaxis protein